MKNNNRRSNSISKVNKKPEKKEKIKIKCKRGLQILLKDNRIQFPKSF